MLVTVKKDKANGLLLRAHQNLQIVLSSEKGQTLVEHSLVVGSVSGSIAIVRDNPYLMIGLAILVLILLLFWRPKLFATLVFIAVLVAVIFFIYRWVEYGHL